MLKLRYSDVELVSDSSTIMHILSLYEYKSSSSSKNSIIADYISLKNSYVFRLDDDNSNAIKSSRYSDKRFECDLSKEEIICIVSLLPIYEIADDSSDVSNE